MTISEFNKMTDINLLETHQKALFGAVSINDYSQQGNKVHVLYDFGNIIVLQNNIIEDNEIYGSVFSYPNHSFIDIGYEYNTVTGVIFIQK